MIRSPHSVFICELAVFIGVDQVVADTRALSELVVLLKALEADSTERVLVACAENVLALAEVAEALV